MDLSLTEEQEALVASFAELLAKHSPPERVREAEPLGHDAALWETLSEVGALTMAVPESAGGWGAELTDLALVAEKIGAALAPAPLLETQCAARLLATVPGVAASDALAGALSGERIITLAVRPPSGGVATLVPAGAIATSAVMRTDDELLLVSIDDDHRCRVENLGSAPLADVDVAQATVLESGPEAVSRFETALDEWLTLTAAALVGMAEAAHSMACEYALERYTWGKLIGTYQAVAHPLADDRTAIDGARLITQNAACALDSGAQRGRELASMAFAFTSETARDATYDALHFHGGYGFVLEHDVQLYYRRARGWPRVWGDANEAYRRAATARYGEQEV